MVLKLTGVKNWYKILTNVINWYQSISNNNYEELILNRHCGHRYWWQNCEELESKVKFSSLGYFIHVRNTHVCYVQFDLHVVRIFSQSVRCPYEIYDTFIPSFHVL